MTTDLPCSVSRAERMPLVPKPYPEEVREDVVRVGRLAAHGECVATERADTPTVDPQRGHTRPVTGRYWSTQKRHQPSPRRVVLAALLDLHLNAIRHVRCQQRNWVRTICELMAAISARIRLCSAST